MNAEEIKKWAGLLKETRKFFDSEGFVEVMTPNLVTVGAFEATLECLKVEHSQGRGELHTSPELAMKCLLANAPIPIYQICKSYRDDPPNPIHFLEFVMLEFYQPNANYRDVLKVTQRLMECVAAKKLDWVEMSVSEAWKNLLAINLGELEERGDFGQEVVRLGLVNVTEGDSWEDIFFKVMLTHIEPGLSRRGPVILCDYPGRLCTLLAKRGSVVERFEIYWQGMEICNGGTELVDEKALNDRYEIECEARRASGRRPHGFPAAFCESIARLPPLAGVAIGMDRLKMCLDKMAPEIV